MVTLFYLGAGAKSFGGESLRVRVVLGETERPGVFGKGCGKQEVLGQWGHGIFSPTVALGRDALIHSPVVLFYFFFFQAEKRNLVLETEKIPFFSSHFPVGLTYI